MSLPTGLHIFSASSEQQDSILKSIVYIHASCVLNDHTMAAFIPPLSFDRMLDRWTQFSQEACERKRIIVLWLASVEDRSNPSGRAGLQIPFGGTEGSAEWPCLQGGLEVGGTISLSLPASETGPFRGLVHNLFVHPLHRRKGIATTLLKELERYALEAGRWSLMLDTTVGTPAEKMYKSLAWERLGIVKDYGLRPTGTYEEIELADEVWFWKDLRVREGER